MNVLSYPKRIVIELTPKCNLSCPMCPGQFIQRSEGFISTSLWKKLINELSQKNPDTVVIPFWRGESLLHPKFIHLLEYALEKSVKLHISTNGHKLTKAQSDILARCEFVTFSVHTSKGYSNAKQFLSCKSGETPVVQLSFVRGEKTTGDILRTILATRDLEGFDSIRLYEEHTKEGVFGRFAASCTETSREFCKKLENTLVIAYDGSISRCNHIWETEDGPDLNEINIQEAWLSDNLKQIRDNYPDDKCGMCDQWIGHTLGESWRIEDGSIEHRVFSV